MTVENIKWHFAPEENITTDVAAIIRQRLLKLNVAVKDWVDMANGMIVYSGIDTSSSKKLLNKHLFTSIVKNIIPLLDTDPRAIKFGRNYLESPRLTKAQWDGIVVTFTEVFDGLKLHANIKLYEFDNDDTSFIMLRSGVEHGTWPQPTKFTMPKGSV